MPTEAEYLCDFVSGSLSRWDKELEMYEVIVNTASISIKKTDEFEYYFTLHSDSNTLLQVKLSDELQCHFDRKNKSFDWTIHQDEEEHALRFVFEDTQCELEFKSLFAMKLFEAVREEPFEKMVGKEMDHDWIDAAYDDASDVDEDGDVDMMDWDDNHNIARPELEFNDEKEKNSHLEVSMNNNRSYVVRGAQIGVFKHSADNEMEYVTHVSKLKDKNGTFLSPKKVMLHKGDRHLMMLNPNDKTKMYNLDLEAEKIVEEFNVMDDIEVNDISQSSRYAQRTDEDTFYGVNDSSLFLLDPRVSTPNKRVDGKGYQKAPKFSSIASNGKGQIVAGSKTGEIRLFSHINKRAKTLFPGLGRAITGVETTEDGMWILATTDSYLLVIPTVLQDGRTGFDKSMGKDRKPKPYKLQILPNDLAAYGIRKVKFTKAHFDSGEGVEEQWIVASTGPFIITWDFRRIKRRGTTKCYTIKKCAHDVVADQFRYNMADQVVVTMPDEVMLETRSNRTPRKSRR